MNDHAGSGPHIFIRKTVQPPAGGVVSQPRNEQTLTDDLLGPLQRCVLAADGWTEFGVIERRLQAIEPDIFARHVAERGHRMLGPKETTASGARVSTALTRLAAQGQHLTHREGRSTGAAWKHSALISYWLVTGGDTTKTLTWQQYCTDTGRSDDWTDADRAGLVSPAQGLQ